MELLQNIHFQQLQQNCYTLYKEMGKYDLLEMENWKDVLRGPQKLDLADKQISKQTSQVRFGELKEIMFKEPKSLWLESCGKKIINDEVESISKKWKLEVRKYNCLSWEIQLTDSVLALH